MNGVHDLGGMDGLGKIEAEPNEPVFHAPWEGRVIAMMRAMGAAGAWNLDMFRDAREHQPALQLLFGRTDVGVAFPVVGEISARENVPFVPVRPALNNGKAKRQARRAGRPKTSSFERGRLGRPSPSRHPALGGFGLCGFCVLHRPQIEVEQ
jgi:nitrile hydratase subunit beta